MKMITDHDFYSLRSHRGWQTRRNGKDEPLVCPGCGERIRGSALDHTRRKHVDLYQRRARKEGLLL